MKKQKTINENKNREKNSKIINQAQQADNIKKTKKMNEKKIINKKISSKYKKI